MVPPLFPTCCCCWESIPQPQVEVSDTGQGTTDPSPLSLGMKLQLQHDDLFLFHINVDCLADPNTNFLLKFLLFSLPPWTQQMQMQAPGHLPGLALHKIVSWLLGTQVNATGTG